MRKWPWVIAFYLLLGLVATLAVAWWLAMTVSFAGRPVATAESIEDGLAVSATRHQRTGARRYSTFTSRAPGDFSMSRGDMRAVLGRWLQLANPTAGFVANEHDVEVTLVCAYGWPFPALSIQEDYAGVVEVNGAISQPPRLPTRPIWIGLLGDAGVSALVFFATVAGGQRLWSRLVRRRLRLRRGLCPRCAYPMGVGPVCTECGQPLPASSGPQSG